MALPVQALLLESIPPPSLANFAEIICVWTLCFLNVDI